MFAINNQDLTSTDVPSKASDSHHGQSKSQGHLCIIVNNDYKLVITIVIIKPLSHNPADHHVA